jgi:hypothetical protein
MRKLKGRSINVLSGAFRRSRSTVERLEDRILLSAEPLVQFNRVDSEQALVVENLAHQVDPRPIDSLDVTTISSIASLIDLTKPQAQQYSKFNWTGSTSSLLKLNSQLSALVLDLGEGSSQMSLSNDGNGMLRLSRLDDQVPKQGENPYDFVFAKPTSILGIRGEGGLDIFAPGRKVGNAGHRLTLGHLRHGKLPAIKRSKARGIKLLGAKGGVLHDSLP